MRFSDDELRDLAPAYAMGTLDAEERVAFEAALAANDWLRVEVDGHRATVEALATAARVTPPPALRERVLARIATLAPDETTASTARVDAWSDANGRASSPAADAPAAASPPPLDVVRGEGRDGARVPPRDASRPTTRQAAAPAPRRWLAPALLGAALAASLAVVVAQRAGNRALREELAASRRALAGRDSTLAVLLDAERDVRVITLTSTASAEPGVQLFWNVRARRALLRAYGMRPAPAGRTYQLWLIRDGMPVRMPVFDTDATGRAIVADLAMPADAAAIGAIAVTVEPAGGSPAPTSTPILVGTVARGE
jgi:anti-sigma-K factor RskA